MMGGEGEEGEEGEAEAGVGGEGEGGEVAVVVGVMEGTRITYRLGREGAVERKPRRREAADT